MSLFFLAGPPNVHRPFPQVFPPQFKELVGLEFFLFFSLDPFPLLILCVPSSLDCFGDVFPPGIIPPSLPFEYPISQVAPLFAISYAPNKVYLFHL